MLEMCPLRAQPIPDPIQVAGSDQEGQSMEGCCLVIRTGVDILGRLWHKRTISFLVVSPAAQGSISRPRTPHPGAFFFTYLQRFAAGIAVINPIGILDGSLQD
jgi:hypothetical protein